MPSQIPLNPNLKIDYDPTKLKTIYLAGGCFWGTQAYMARVPGVADTAAGYANGQTENPTYEEVCTLPTGHAETVRVRYDPGILPLEKLLEEFFKTINPTQKGRQGNDVGDQYRNGIYYTDEKDVPVIRAVIEREQMKYDRPIATEVEPIHCFYDAEEYHQDYLEKNPGGYCHVDLSRLNE